MERVLNQKNTYKCKVVLLGEQAVGKSSLALRFVKQTFTEFHSPTIGAAFLTKHVSIEDYAIKFEIWDTAGQERFHSLAPMYYRGSNAAIVMYDITNLNSFSKAKKWIEELYLQADSELVIMLAGNKADLTKDRMVKFNDASQYAKEQNLLFIETSAKLFENINELFLMIGKHCPKKTESSNSSSNKVNLSNAEQNHCCTNA